MGHIVAVRDEINRSALQFIQIARLNRQCNALTLQFAQLIARIIASALHIAVKQHLVHKVHGANHIVRIAGIGVCEMTTVHHADLIFRVYGVGGLHGLRAGQKLMICSSHAHRFILGINAARNPRLCGHAVDLIKGQPQLYAALEVLK